MISFEDAKATILDSAQPLEKVTVPLMEALGSCLTEPVVAPMDLPMFDNSAVDGYGVRVADGGAERTMKGAVPAGSAMDSVVGEKECVRLFTGAPVPLGVDAIVMQEDAQASNGRVRILDTPRAGQHIRRRGEEIRAGEAVLDAGSLITPSVVGIIASLGYGEVSVFRKPRVAIVGTGSELCEPGQPLAPGKIYESNTRAVQAALGCLGLEVVSRQSVVDEIGQTTDALREATERADVVITCGGVSVGDHDLIRPGLQAIGVKEVFWKVAVKPGKPFMFAITPEGKLVFGLPGNPVSALVTYHALVRPALLKMMGGKVSGESCAALASAVEKQAGRHELVRGVLKNGMVAPTEGQGSHMLSGLATANCLIHAPAAATRLKQGEMVRVSHLQWGML